MLSMGAIHVPICRHEYRFEGLQAKGTISKNTRPKMHQASPLGGS